jgi:hypothetical protein
VVIEANDKLSVYRMWFQDFTLPAITRELEEAGFAVQSVWGDLLGSPFTADSEWIGLVTRI